MQQLSLNLGLDIVPITKDPHNSGDIYRLYNAVKLVAGALDTYTGTIEPDTVDWSSISPAAASRVQNISKIYVPFYETVGAGLMVTLVNSAGVLKARKAFPSIGQVQGFSLHNVTAGNYGPVCLFGLHTVISGLTAGAVYYMSNITAGTITATQPNNNGNTVQKIGFAISDKALWFNPTEPTIIPITPEVS